MFEIIVWRGGRGVLHFVDGAVAEIWHVEFLWILECGLSTPMGSLNSSKHTGKNLKKRGACGGRGGG